MIATETSILLIHFGHNRIMGSHMLKCYFDENGFARADAPAGKEMLGNYFVEDIQGDTEDCHELLRIVSEITEGRLDEWKGTGNAHTLTINESGITIENEWDESLGQCEVTASQFREAAYDWLSFISKHTSGAN